MQINLVHRVFSAHLREPAGEPAVPAKPALVVSAFPEENVHHGHELVIAVAIENRGDTPLYDAVVVNGIPANTTFVRFPITDTRTRGFLHFHLAGERSIVWKLYRPLAPGETFKATFVVRLDPWLVFAKD